MTLTENNNYKDLIIELTRKEIKIKYKNSYLGYLWSLANPLLMALIFYFVFQVITRMEMENYALFLVTGLFIWTWLANTIQMSTMLFVGNAPLIKKVLFPRSFLAIALVISEGFNFFFSIPIIIGFMIYYNLFPSLYWLIGIPFMFCITAIFIYGMSLLIGSINLFFRDIERIITLLMTVLFYGTPILYPASMIPEKLHYMLYLNPFTSFVISWRDILLNNTFNIEFIGLSIVYAIIAYVLGTYVYNKLKFKFAELI
jgi:lipopolysaccharide transport system permease protein